MKADNWLDRFLFTEYATAPETLAVYRMIYALCVLLIYLPQHLWVSDFPDSFFDPPFGLALLFSGFPSHGFLVALNGLLIVAACLLLAGYLTRWAAITVGVLLLAGNAFAYSFGKINNDILMVLIPLVLQFSGWGDAYAIDARRKPPINPARNAWPVALMALLIGLAMVTAAVPKAATGWLNIHTHAVLGHLLRNMFLVGRTGGITAAMLSIKSDVFWEALDYGTVILEAAFLFTVVSSRAFRIVCAMACFFHFGIALTMQISYWPNILAYAVVCCWPTGQAPGWYHSLLSLPGKIRPLVLSAVSIGLAVLYLALGNPLKTAATRIHPESDAVLGFIVCAIAAGVAAYFLARQLRCVMTRFRLDPLAVPDRSHS